MLWSEQKDKYIDKTMYRDTVPPEKKKKGFLSGDFPRRDEFSNTIRTSQLREVLHVSRCPRAELRPGCGLLRPAMFGLAAMRFQQQQQQQLRAGSVKSQPGPVEAAWVCLLISPMCPGRGRARQSRRPMQRRRHEQWRTRLQMQSSTMRARRCGTPVSQHRLYLTSSIASRKPRSNWDAMIGRQAFTT